MTSYHLSTRHPQGSRLNESRPQKEEKYRSLQVGFHFNPSNTWQADLTYTFSRREGRENFGDREEEQPERNELWLKFTWATPWRF